jgi:hypothetical protein
MHEVFDTLRLAGVAVPNNNKVTAAESIAGEVVQEDLTRICTENITNLNKSKEPVQVLYDEQHSRPQRTHGRAPHASAVFLGPDAEILNVTHVDEHITTRHGCKDKGKAARELGMAIIAKLLLIIHFFIGDGCLLANSLGTSLKASRTWLRQAEMKMNSLQRGWALFIITLKSSSFQSIPTNLMRLRRGFSTLCPT